LIVKSYFQFHYKSPAVAEMGTVATKDMGRKEGGADVPLSRELGPRLVQCGLG